MAKQGAKMSKKSAASEFRDKAGSSEALLTKSGDISPPDDFEDPYHESPESDSQNSPPLKEQEEKDGGGAAVRGWPWCLLVSAIASVMFFYCLDKSVTTILIPIIVSELGDAQKLPWLLVGFGMGSLSLALPIGKLYSLYNAKTLYLGFLGAFVVGSGLCGVAWNMNVLIIGRVIAGMGGIGLYTGVMTLITALTSAEERPVYIGVIGLFWGIGRVIGPLFGGALGKSAWRWGFYVNLIVCGVFTPVYIFLLPNFHPLPEMPLLERLRKFDALGTILSMMTIVSLFMAVNFGGTTIEWNSELMALMFLTALASLTFFAIQQGLCLYTTPKDRLFPVNMLFIPEACLIFIISATSTASGFLPAQFISLYFQFTRGDSALDAALRLLPMIIAMSIVLPTAGYLTPKIGYLEFWPIAGSLVALPGTLLMFLLNTTTEPLIIYIAEALIGAGMSFFMQLPYTLIGSYIPKSQKHASTSFLVISQIGSIAASLSISGALFTSAAVEKLTELLPNSSKLDIEQALSGTSGQFLKTVPPETLDTALDILVTSMSPAWLVGYTALVIGFIASVVLVFLTYSSKRRRKNSRSLSLDRR